MNYLRFIFVGIIIQSAVFCYSQKEILESGFYLNLGTFSPTKKFLALAEIDGEKVEFEAGDKDDPSFSLGVKFEIGNNFTIVNKDPIAFGIRATWLTLAAAPWGDKDTIADAAFYVDLLGVGAFGSFAINDDMAVDAYYVACPTIITTTELDFFNGTGHKFGLCYRYKIFTVGFDYTLGKVQYRYTEYNGTNVSIATLKLYDTTARLYLGFKF